MPYGTFRSVSEIARLFDIEVGGSKPFAGALKIEIRFNIKESDVASGSV
jgi:hypothetical protein